MMNENKKKHENYYSKYRDITWREPAADVGLRQKFLCQSLF
jgi:hypothetical protein